MRGIAALAVTVFHYTTHYQKEVGHLSPIRIGFPWGDYGVHLFFVISGFVILMTLERTRSAMDFVVSRFSRLFPAYWAAVVASAAVVYAIGMPQQRIPVGDLFGNLTMVQGLLGAQHLDGSYWTLQIELLFYAQMLFWFSLGQLKRVHWIVAAWMALALAYGLSVRYSIHFSYWIRELLILKYIPFFALGVLFYRVWSRPSELVRNAALIGACNLVVLAAMEPLFIVVSLVCTSVFALFVTGRLRWLRHAPFAYLGTISYSLYLLHQAIGFALIWHFERIGFAGEIAGLLALALVLLGATLLTRFVEQPALKAIRAAWTRRTRTASASTLR